MHIELTGDDVTECLGGVDKPAESDLTNRYETACDPRPNRKPVPELAFITAERLADSRIGRDAVSPLARFRSIDL